MRRFLRNRDHLYLLALLVIGVIAYFSLENSNGHVGGFAELDGYYYYIYLRSMQMDGNLDLTNDYRRWGNPFKFGKTSTGRARNVFGVGPAILWTPFFLVTHLLVLIGIKLGYPLSPDGMSRFHQLGTFLGTLVYGWIAVLLCYHVARRTIGPKSALWAALGAALSGPLPCYSLNYASYSHAHAAFCCSLMFFLWIRWRGNWTMRRWVLFGASAGLLLLVRPACVSFMILPLIEGCLVIWRALQDRHQGLSWLTLCGPFAGAGAAFCVFLPQMVAWYILYGQPLITPQGQDFMWWSKIAWHATLFSPRNGLFPSAPLLTLSLLGIGLLYRKQRGLCLALGTTFIALVLVNGAVSDWWGWGFSARRYSAALPIFTIGLAVSLDTGRQWISRSPTRAAAWITAVVVLLAILFNLQWMRLFTQKNLTWSSVRSTEGLYMTVTHRLFEKFYSTLGNPFSLPSSLGFALRHGGSPKTYDRIEGYYLLGESTRGANPSAPPLKNATMALGDLKFRYNLSDSFGNPKQLGTIRYAPLRRREGHIFVPINRPGKLKMMIVAQAIHKGTVVKIHFNGHRVSRKRLPHQGWSRHIVTIPARWIRRGINRLDLIHDFPAGWDDPGSRCFGVPKTCLPVDLAAVSGGRNWGNFAEIWVDNRRVTHNVRGLNIAVIDPSTGVVLGTRAFDVFAYPTLYSEGLRYLASFPKGSVVALASRDQPHHNFKQGGKELLAAIGAQADLRSQKKAGYVAIGLIGARAGTALEQTTEKGHARVRLGRKPPPWRELVRYYSIRVR